MAGQKVKVTKEILEAVSIRAECAVCQGSGKVAQSTCALCGGTGRCATDEQLAYRDQVLQQGMVVESRGGWGPEA